MGTVLGYIIALLVVGGLLFLAASYTFGRGEEMAPVLPDGTPVELPDDRLAGGDDLRALRLSVAVRGYRMDEVDWLLDRMAEQVDTRDREIARLRSVLHVEPVEPELLTHPFPPVVDATDYQAEHARTDTDDAPADDPDRATTSRPHGADDDVDDVDDSSRPHDTDSDAEDRADPPGPRGVDAWAGSTRRAPAEATDLDGDGGSAWAPREVPEGTGDSGARPDRPAKHVRTAEDAE